MQCYGNCSLIIRFSRGAAINMKVILVFQVSGRNMQFNCPVLCKATISSETSVTVGECMDNDRDSNNDDGGES